MLSQTLLALATAATTSAHFVLNWPPTAGFLDDEEVNGPCGGATVTVNSSSPEVQVGRFAAQIQSSHPTGNWQFRATLDTQEPYNWTNLSMVQTEGPGIFCLNYLSAPENFAGNAGILQVIDYSGDGTLYQCAAVNFATGTNDTLGDSCSNSTSTFKAEWTNSTESEGGEDHGDGDHDHSGASTSSAASGSETAAAATSASSQAAGAIATAGMGAFVGGLGALAAGLML
ncbi:hypothetical protein Q7P35_002983 [Cladosporium inversicolor]